MVAAAAAVAEESGLAGKMRNFATERRTPPIWVGRIHNDVELRSVDAEQRRSLQRRRMGARDLSTVRPTDQLWQRDSSWCTRTAAHQSDGWLRACRSRPDFRSCPVRLVTHLQKWVTPAWILSLCEPGTMLLFGPHPGSGTSTTRTRGSGRIVFRSRMSLDAAARLRNFRTAAKVDAATPALQCQCRPRSQA